MLDTATMLHLIGGYGYPIVAALLLVAAAGLPLPVGVVLLALGLLSGRDGQLDLTLLAVAGTLASVAGDLLDYAAGRFGVEHLPGRLRRALDNRANRAGRVQALMERHAGLAIFLTRFLLTPFALPVNLLAGASRTGLRRFLLWDVAGEAVFVAGSLFLGRFLGGIPAPLGALPWLALAAVALAPLVAIPAARYFRPRHGRSHPAAAALPAA